MSNTGATIWARQTIESDIFFYKPAVWFKIWFYIVSRVNFRDEKLFKRGECLITYEEIMAKTKASKPQVHKCIKFLEKDNMIESRRTTRGMVRFVVNYAKYQDFDNYKDNSKTTRETTDGQLTDNSRVLPIVEEWEERKKEKNQIYVTDDAVTMKKEFQDFLQTYNSRTGRKTIFLPERFMKYQQRRKRWGAADILTAMENILKDEFLQGKNDAGKIYGDIDYCLRNDKNIEKFLISNPIKTWKHSTPPSALSIEF